MARQTKGQTDRVYSPPAVGEDGDETVDGDTLAHGQVHGHQLLVLTQLATNTQYVQVIR